MQFVPKLITANLLCSAKEKEDLRVATGDRAAEEAPGRGGQAGNGLADRQSLQGTWLPCIHGHLKAQLEHRKAPSRQNKG